MLLLALLYMWGTANGAVEPLTFFLESQISNLIFYFPFYILSTIKITFIISYIEA